MIPQVSDVDKELEAITEEKQKKMELYSFAPTNTPDDGDEEWAKKKNIGLSVCAGRKKSKPRNL